MKKELIAGLLARGAVGLLACGAAPCCQAMFEETSSSSGASAEQQLSIGTKNLEEMLQGSSLSAEQQQKVRERMQRLPMKVENLEALPHVKQRIHLKMQKNLLLSVEKLIELQQEMRKFLEPYTTELAENKEFFKKLLKGVDTNSLKSVLDFVSGFGGKIVLCQILCKIFDISIPDLKEEESLELSASTGYYSDDPADMDIKYTEQTRANAKCRVWLREIEKRIGLKSTGSLKEYLESFKYPKKEVVVSIILSEIEGILCG
ncbi:MAG: hypothetical protein LBG13_00840 [Holosporales bacterium]|jgi:hypothetical protein|nr:hypothetical protein [Holosporales bacterium]